MPLAPGFHRYYGLGLYNSPLGLLIVEGGLWVIGIILYLRAYAHAPLRCSSRTLDIHCGVHCALVTELQRRATTKRARSRDGRSHPLSHRARLGILDRSFATAERDLRARVTGNLDITPKGRFADNTSTMYPQCRRREHCVVRSSRISALPGDISMNRVLVAILFLFLPASSLADDLLDIKPVADGIYAAIAKPAYKVNCNAAIIIPRRRRPRRRHSLQAFRCPRPH